MSTDSQVPDSPPPEAETTGPATGAPDDGPDTGPQKPKGPIRWSGVIVLSVLLLLLVGTAWFLADPLLRSGIRTAITSAGFQLDEQTALDTDAFGGRIAFRSFALDQRRSAGETKRIAESPAITVDLALWQTLMGNDVIIDELTVDDLRFVMRRYQDGRLPIEPPPPADLPPDAEPPPPTDWLALWEQAQVWRERLGRYLGGDADQAGTVGHEPPVAIVVDPDEPHAIHYQPAPQRGANASRTVIRKLALRVAEGQLPQSLAAARAGEPAETPFDIEEAVLEGDNVAWLLTGEERMTLGTAHLRTRAAGELRITRFDRGAADGHFTLSWADLPLASLGHPAVAPQLASWGMSGVNDLTLELAWDRGQLTGTLAMEILDLALAPSGDAPGEVHQAAKALDQARSQYAKLGLDEPLAIRWQIGISGTPGDLRFSGAGAGGLATAIRDTVQDITRRVAGAAADQLKEAGKDLAGQGKEAGKQVIGDVLEGGDPVQSGSEAGKDLEDKAKEAAGGLKDIFKR